MARGFLVVTPGITIKDRLRVLLPSDPDNYYRTRELVPQDMMNELGNAKVVVTNYHAFQLRERLDTNKTGRAVLSGWRNEQLRTRETEGEMLQRACGELLTLKNIVVVNDEAHHATPKPAEASAAGHGGLALRGLHEVKEFPGQGANPTPRLLTKASNCDRAAMSVSWLAALRQSASATYG